MAGWIKQSKQSVPLHDLFPAEAEAPIAPETAVEVQPVAAPETEGETHLLDMLKEQALARLQKAQRVLADREKRAAEERAKGDAEAREAEAAYAEVARIEAQEAQEAARAEEVRKQRALEEYRASGAVTDLLKSAVSFYEQTQKQEPVEQARTIFSEYLRAEAPEAGLWRQDGLTFECPIFERAYIQIVTQPGADDWRVNLFPSGETFPNGIGALTLHDRATLGRYILEYPALAEWLGFPKDGPSTPTVQETGDLDITQFGSVA